jgi:diguanylate cyclase (GGDEF)-like protein
LLLAICVIAVLGSRSLHGAVLGSERASTVADLYQDARYYAAAEDAELNTYLNAPTAAARAAHGQASARLDRSLLALVGDQPRPAPESQALEQLLAVHHRYQDLSVQVFHLLDSGRDREAKQFERTYMAPLLDGMTTDLQQLEEEHHLTALSQLRVAHQDGSLLLVGVPVIMGLTLLLLAAFTLVTRTYRRTVERQALNDALTGLPNRRLFADRVGHALAASRRTEDEPVVMLLDLDRFKEVNDTLGHHYGDLLLIELAKRIAGLLRPTDTLARLGGDEFAVLLPDGGCEAGTEVAGRILTTIEQPFTLAGITLGVEASIGIATATATADADADVNAETARMPDLLQHADSAMYAAKRERCGFRHYEAGDALATPAHLTLLGELRQAFDRDELVVHYQPKIAVHTGELLGVEALVRWEHPTRGLLAPDEFISLAEGTTLIHRLTKVVLDKALQHSRSWLDRGTRLPVAVNVSARTLLDHTFPATVGERLAAAGVAPDLLCLELTEGTIMADPDRALAILSELHKMGVRLSVDDFGTGYSSMAYLKLLPVDELKVDRTFVRDMTSDPADTVLVQSAIDLGHNLGLSVVAEGVEDAATLAALTEVGADVVQGYYLGRPMTPENLSGWIDGRVRTTPTEHERPDPLVAPAA